MLIYWVVDQLVHTWSIVGNTAALVSLPEVSDFKNVGGEEENHASNMGRPHKDFPQMLIPLDINVLDSAR